MSTLQSHYETVRHRFDYEPANASVLPSWLEPLRRRFVAVDGTEGIDSALDQPTLVCMGIGMTGPPHLGTVGQLLTAIELQAAGLDVQFVLADLEPYHGGGDEAEIRALAERYRIFALDLGFDPERGLLRTQSEARDVMVTGHRLARYYDSDGWADAGDDEATTEWEAAVEDLYLDVDSAARESGPTSAAAEAHSSVLHGADFLHPLRTGEYEQILCCFGIDEHDLTPWTREFGDAAGISGRVGGIYTRMVPGFDGVPKQSKSIDEGVSLADDPAAIRERVRSAVDHADPERSAVFQAMCLASRYDAERLDSLAAACEADGMEWTGARRSYAEYVANLAERWRETAE